MVMGIPASKTLKRSIKVRSDLSVIRIRMRDGLYSFPILTHLAN